MEVIWSVEGEGTSSVLVIGKLSPVGLQAQQRWSVQSGTVDDGMIESAKRQVRLSLLLDSIGGEPSKSDSNLLHAIQSRGL